MSATGVESSVANSTRNFINITTSYKVPFINLTATQAAPIIAAAATATNFQPTAVHAISTSAGASPPPPSPAAAAAPPANASGASVFQQRVSQPPMATAAPPRQLTTIPIQPSRTAATIITNNKRPTVIIYPTVSPESIVIPIVSCILGFPLLALLVICCLRRRAKLARERDRRRNYDMQDHAVSLVRFSPIHRLNNRSSRAISLRPERSLSRGFPSLELDTVIEERSDPEQTQTDIVSPESPLDPQKFRDFNSS